MERTEAHRRVWGIVIVVCGATVWSVGVPLARLHAQAPRETERILCDSESSTPPCALESCECMDGSIEITFDGDRQSVLEYAAFEEDPRVDVVVVLDHPSAGAQGWTYGVAHDPESIDVLSVTFEGTDAFALQDGGFTVARADDIWTCLRPSPDPCRRDDTPPEDLREGGGWISAIVLSFMGSAVLPAGRSTVGRAEYVLKRDVAQQGTRLAFTNRLRGGTSPTTDLSFVVDGRAHQWTRAVDGLVRRAPSPTLERILCDPDDPAIACPGPDCACYPDALEITFDGDAQHALQYEDFTTGMPIDAIVVMNVESDGIVGWNFGVTHDVGSVRVTGLTSEGTDAGALRHEGFEHLAFEEVSLCLGDPCGPETPAADSVQNAGWICAMVLSFVDPTTLPLGRPTLARASYALDRDVGVDGTLLRFTDRLRVPDNPPVTLALLRDWRPPGQWARAVDGWIGRAGGSGSPTPFVRGDVGVRREGDAHPADGRIDVTDVIRILTAVFLDADLVFDCAKAADADDSGSVGLADAVCLARVLFLGAPSPELPAPSDEPGPDPTPDSLGCTRYP